MQFDPVDTLGLVRDYAKQKLSARCAALGAGWHSG
jgi:hypothetical protein